MLSVAAAPRAPRSLLVPLLVLLLLLLFLPPAGAQEPPTQAPAQTVQTRPDIPQATAEPLLDDATLHREYEAYRASLEGLRLYRVRYIRVATDSEAQDLIAQLLGGASFEELARTHSTHEESASRGGDLGTHAGCRWAKATLAMLDSLGQGQTWPAPVRGTHGWGVYRLEAAVPVEPRPFLRYRSEILSGTFHPECPWVPPMTVEAAPPPITDIPRR